MILITDLSKRSLQMCFDFLKREPGAPLLALGEPNSLIRQVARQFKLDVFCLRPCEFNENFEAVYKTDCFEIERAVTGRLPEIAFGVKPRFLWRSAVVTANLKIKLTGVRDVTLVYWK